MTSVYRQPFGALSTCFLLLLHRTAAAITTRCSCWLHAFRCAQPLPPSRNCISRRMFANCATSLLLSLSLRFTRWLFRRFLSLLRSPPPAGHFPIPHCTCVFSTDRVHLRTLCLIFDPFFFSPSLLLLTCTFDLSLIRLDINSHWIDSIRYCYSPLPPSSRSHTF